MRVRTSKRYAVMAMIEVALHQEKGPVNLPDVGVRQNISLPYLEQLFLKLKRHGLVKSTRGQNGGYRLARSPEEINIYDIIVAVDRPVHLTRCANDGKGCLPNQAQCLTHHLWQGLGDKIKSYLQNITLEDLIQGKKASSSPQETDPLPCDLIFS